MIELNKDDIVYINKIKEKIVKSCKKCKGEGYFFKEKVETCQCMKVLKYVMDLKRSNIPFDYFDLSFESLKIPGTFKKEIKSYIDNLDNAVERGIGLLITCDTRGVGKTSLACEIGKAAIRKRYYVYYNLMQNLISDTFSDSAEIKERLQEAEIIIIDEIDKVEMKKESLLTLKVENFLRDILPSNKTVIMCSNMSLSEIENNIRIESLISRYCKIIEIEGEDYGKVRKKSMNDLLTKQVDFFDKEMVKSSNEHHRLEDFASKKRHKELWVDNE